MFDFFKNQWLNIRKSFRFYTGVMSLIVYSISDYMFNKTGRAIANKYLTMQIYFTAVMALKMIGVIAVTIGAVTIIPLFGQLSAIGQPALVGTIFEMLIVRELGPILTAFIVIARSGSAISAEIATMNINDEMNAIEMIGIDSLKMIIFPRVMGMIISMALLTIYFNAAALIGGLVIGYFTSGINFDMFMQYIMKSITLLDVFGVLLKTIAIGAFTAAISIFHGFQAFNSTMVPQVTTKAVVSAIFTMFVVDIIMTVIIFYL